MRKRKLISREEFLGYIDEIGLYDERDRSVVVDIVMHMETINEQDVPLTQTQLREMNHQMVWCVELNMPVEVYAPKKGFILVRYKTPSTEGSERAMNLTLYAKMPAEESEESGGRD